MSASFPKLEVFNHPENFDSDRFSSPPAIDRGTPFWSWNGKLEKDVLFEQLETFKKMGLGGGHMHPRTGMETSYLSDEFMDLVEACANKSDELGLVTWLYDEDRWPSGFAGGLATKDKKHWSKHLRITRKKPEEGEERPVPVHHGSPIPSSEREWVASWGLQFEGDLLKSWRRLTSSDEELGMGEVPLHTYIETLPSNTWFNNAQYVDTLSPEAMGEFIRVTHERYKERLGDRFGKSIPSIFTDEPLFKGMERPKSAQDERDLSIAWTPDLPVSFKEEMGKDLLDFFPAVLYNTTDGSEREARWLFHNHHTNRFSEAFAGQIGAWCETNGLALTGHMMAENSLGSQTAWTGETMRSLQHFQLPGIDMLCDWQEFTTAKQAQSIARQKGAPGVLSELYGVTNWDFPFAGHRRQGNWQAALGIVTRVHHLTWYQMSGEAKRDYPASMGAHSPWHQEYSLVEDHFSRVNVAMKSGKPRCRVAMIHPIESYWMVHGPAADELERNRLEKGFSETLNWLLEGLLDVDFISEATLEELSSQDMNEGFKVGDMNYEAVVLPPLLNLRSSTLTRLSSFIEHGGTVVNTSLAPTHLDGKPVGHGHRWPNWQFCPWEKGALLKSLECFMDMTLYRPHGGQATEAIHQARDLPDGSRIVFLCNSTREQSLGKGSLQIRGHWSVTELDTESGHEQDVGFHQKGDHTLVDISLPVSGHCLLRLKPEKNASKTLSPMPLKEISRPEGPIKITLSEENVLLLDRAQWRLDDGEWQKEEEVLRLDNLAREALGQPHRHGHIAQPWCEPKIEGTHKITLRYSLNAREAIAPSRLAMEDLQGASVLLNGKPLDDMSTGWWVDRAFSTMAIPRLEAGEHVLEVTWPFGGSEGLESMYFLGDFSVWVKGTKAELGAPVKELHCGDATQQGLAFYGGNITYHFSSPHDGATTVDIPHFNGALVTVDQQGKRVGSIDREPWRLKGSLVPDQPVDVTCYGTRINTFGQIHIVASDHYRWWGPDSWRTRGHLWSDNYQLKQTGLLSEPIFIG
jgi:hypothetical protein